MFKIKRKKKNRSSDESFKALMHNSDILSWILRGNLEEFKDMDIEEIKDCLTLGKNRKFVIGRDKEYVSRRHGRIELDTAFDVRIPGTNDKVSVIVGIEGQNDPEPGYPLGKRAEYYLARMVSAQKEIDFKGSDYGSLRRCYSIWCVMDPRSDDKNTVVRYGMKAEVVHGEKGYVPEKLDTFNVIMINIGEYSSDLPDSLAFPAALFSDMEEEGRKELVNERFKFELGDDELEMLKDMSTLDQDKFNHGRRVGKAEGRAEGIVEGEAKGRAEGRTEGKIESASEGVIFYMKEMGISVDEALSRYPIPDEYRSEVEKEVRRRLSR